MTLYFPVKSWVTVISGFAVKSYFGMQSDFAPKSSRLQYVLLSRYDLLPFTLALSESQSKGCNKASGLLIRKFAALGCLTHLDIRETWATYWNQLAIIFTDVC